MQFVVVSYDIPDDKRRLRVASVLLDFGAAHVQRSVFELYVTTKHFDRLRTRLAELHNNEEDSLRFYLLCGTCRDKVVYLGQAAPIDEPGLRII